MHLNIRIVLAIDLELWYLFSLHFVSAVKLWGPKLFMIHNMVTTVLKNCFILIYFLFRCVISLLSSILFLFVWLHMVLSLPRSPCTRLLNSLQKVYRVPFYIDLIGLYLVLLMMKRSNLVVNLSWFKYNIGIMFWYYRNYLVRH